MGKNKVIMVQIINVTVSEENFDDYICITDIAKAKVGESRGADVVKNWMRNRATLEFLGTWEKSIILLLKWSNSTTLKAKQVYIHLY